MRVLLVAPPIMDDDGLGPRPIGMDAVRECPPYGMYLLHAVLLAQGHDSRLADLIAVGTESIADVPVEDVELVGIGATSMSWPTALKVVAQVRARSPQTKIVVGGIHPTMFDWYLLANFGVDYVVRGEGERPLSDLVSALERGDDDLSHIWNLTWRTPQGRVIRNPTGPGLSADELADFPVPDYSVLPDGVYQGLSIESSRGCAFDCSFCSTSYRRSFRGMEPSRFVDRLEQVLQHQNRAVQSFTHIIDDEFSMNPRRAISIVREFESRGMRPSLVYDSRANDLLFEGYVDAIAPYTYQFLLGAECGYDDGLKKVGKGTTVEALTNAAQMLSKYGIADRADFSFILGLPWETLKEVNTTCEFALSLHERYGVRVLLQWYCQIPGSRLWQDARDRGEVTEAMYNEFGFFRDLYLFRTGVRLTNSEIEGVSRRLRLAVDIAAAQARKTDLVQYAHPEPLRLYFPDILREESDALANLRELSVAGRGRSPADTWVDLGASVASSQAEGSGVGRPLRHISL